MTQNIDQFLQDCSTFPADGSLTSLDELEGLYVYWCSLRDEEARTTEAVLDVLGTRGVEAATYDGVDYVEGLILTGPVKADFILSCDFAGFWGQPNLLNLAVRSVATAS